MRAVYLLCAMAVVIGCGSDDGVGGELIDAGTGDVVVEDGVHVDVSSAEAGDGAMEDAAAESVVAPFESGRDSSDAMPDAPGVAPCAAGTVDCDANGTCEDLETNPADCGKCGHGCLGGACLGSQCQPFPIATDLTFPMGVVVLGADVYATTLGNPFARNGSLIRITANGTVTEIESGIGAPASLWYDQVTDSFLMPDYFGHLLLSRPVHADAGSVTTLISNRLSSPLGTASNAASVFIVNVGDLSSEGPQTIQRRSRSDLTQYGFFSEIPAEPAHLDIDANYLYWTEFVAGRVVRQPVGADPDAGATPVEVITSGQPKANGIAVDGTNIYFSRYGTSNSDGGPIFGVIMRVDNRPGSTAVQLAMLPGDTEDVAVDTTAIYIAGRGSGTIWKLAK
jgi:hypothetical protein